MQNNNCNDSYEKIRKKIEEFNKNIKYIYIQGPTGPKGEGAATITIGNTLTGESGTNAIVTNVGTNKDVILNFTIPKGIPGKDGSTGPQGIKGDIGPQGNKGDIGPTGPRGERGIPGLVGPTGLEGPKGDVGPTGPKGDVGPTGPKGDKGDPGSTETGLYNALLFVSIPETTVSGVALLGSNRVIPGVNQYFNVKDNTTISIEKSGIYEVTLCGRISGVTSNTGASFYLYDATNNQKVTDLVFELKKGNTPEMNFSEVNLLEVINSKQLQIKTEIENDTSNSITFSDINILIKRYNI